MDRPEPPEKNKILQRCLSDPDILLDNFHSNLSREILQYFGEKDITLEKLLDFQFVVPTVYPWDNDYDKYRHSEYPWMIVLAETAKHVEISVEWAYKRKITVTENMVIDQSRRTDIQVYENENIVSLESGCLIGSVQLELSKHNLAFVGDFCATSCISSCTNTGFGLLTRKYGLSSDNLLEVEIVLYNGNRIRANSKKHSDLFWAFRGANSLNFGLVTELVFRVYPISEVIIFDANFPSSRVKEIINLWQHWAPFVVDELTSKLVVSNNRVLVTGQYLGNKASLKRLLHPIRNLNPDEFTIQRIPFIDACRKFTGQSKSRSGLVKRFLPFAALNIIEHIKGAEFYAFGGVPSRIPSNKTAFSHRLDTILWYYGPESLFNELSSYLTLEHCYGFHTSRLIEIKQKYNPENLFQPDL